MENLWVLHSLSASYGQRPSSFLGLAPASWEAWQLDVATLQAGRWMESKLAERDEKGRPVWTVEKLLAQRQRAPQTQSFAAMKQFARKVRIRADGTWE